MELEKQKKNSTTVRRVAMVTAAVLTVGLALVAGAGQPGSFEGAGWLQGAQGLFNAIEKVRQDDNDKPLLVYFYAEWCGYCRQVERDLLSTPQLRAFAEKSYAVMINPDKGERENGIARYYNVRGYPSFFVYGRKSGRLIAIERHNMVNGRPVLLKPAEFIARIQQASEQ